MAPKYIAWLSRKDDGSGFTSVAVGSLREVEAKAIEIQKSELWRAHEGPRATLRITTYGKQLFAKSIKLGY